MRHRSLRFRGNHPGEAETETCAYAHGAWGLTLAEKYPSPPEANECKNISLRGVPCPMLRSGLRPLRVRCSTLHTQTKGRDSELNRARQNNNNRLFLNVLLLVEAKQYGHCLVAVAIIGQSCAPHVA